MKKEIALLLAATFALSSTALAEIKIVNPWVRASTGPNAALFMEIVNTSNKPAKLIAAQTKTASRTEYHSHYDDDGVMRMSKVGFIEVPADGNTVLTPGGHHIMLLDINRPLEIGSNIHVICTFENKEAVDIVAPVRAM